MEPVFLKTPIDSNPSNDVNSDLNAPFSFIEWKQRRPFVIEKQALFQYNDYVIQWFSKNKTKKISQKFLLRQKYLYLLDQLQLFFSDEEKHTWYNNIDLMDEKELLMAIPYFARKLKHIALYYLNLRKDLKNTKLKYNTVGTAFGVEQNLYNTIITGFSTLSKELDPTVLSNVPDLSSITQTLVIQVEELYDDKDYFDVSPSHPIKDRFDVTHSATTQYYQTKGINLSSEEWMLGCLSLSSTSDFDTFVNNITGTFFESTDEELYSSFVAKYLSENEYSLTFTKLSSEIDLTETVITKGHNYFYYPGGVTDPTILFEKKLKNVSLSSIDIKGSTAGTTLEDCDTIFIKNGNTLKGAWLKYNEFSNTDELVEANIKEYGSTSFIFPYPGYGLSSEEIAWTGPSLTTTTEYEFLPNNIRASINDAYWSQEIGENEIVPIQINTTTLLENGSIPHTNPNFADRITTRTNDFLDTTTPAFMLSGAWLYKFDRALFPISQTTDLEKNRFLWPYELIDTKEEYPFKYKDINFSDTCEPVSIKDLNSIRSIGSNKFETSDKIYKFENYSDDTELATECCWLSCATQVLTNHKSFAQNGFNALFDSGKAERFIWNGPNNTPLDDVFKAIEHKDDCPFVSNIPEISSLDWEKCSCKQVYYSPFGHSGNFFEDNNSFADFIVKDPKNGTQDFNLDSWRYIDGTPFKGSMHVAWYKTSKDKPTWGYGKWVNNNSPLSDTPFLLETGQSYFYKRAKNKTGSSINPSEFPPYTVHYAYTGTNKGTWMGARLNEEEEWVSTSLPSNMILRSGDVVQYERTPETVQYLISSEQVENINENRGSIWSTFDYIVLDSSQSKIYISWPDSDPPIGSSSNQFPSFDLLGLKELYWWKIEHTTNPSISSYIESPFTWITESSTVFIPPSSVQVTPVTTKSYSSKTTIPFAPSVVGEYRISVKAKAHDGTIVTLPDSNTTIPLLSVVPSVSNRELLIKQGTKSNGFLLEQPLRGWNYLVNTPAVGGSGAKPFWAELYIGKNTENRFKGAFSWGYSNNFVDEYIPDHCPRLSPIQLTYGEALIYDRVGPPITWSQPVTFKSQDGSSMWCELSVVTNEFSNLSAIYESKQMDDLTVYQFDTPTDIVLTNILDGFPVQLFYYALNSFTWTLSTEIENVAETPNPVLNIKAAAPWANLNNRFFSTVATIPLLDEIYSESAVGGYFIPQNLGASLAMNKDFDPILDKIFLSGSVLTEDTSIHIGGRGRSRQDQDTFYSWSEQNQWMKEPSTANKLAGTVKRNLTKTLQTFAPYQEGSEETALGLITPTSRVSPWGERLANVWTDDKNKPFSFTGIPNVSAWADTQILKQNQLVVDNWSTDIFGNQYSLFKNLSGVSVSNRRRTVGELWTKTNNGMVMPATESLSSVLNLFETHTFYSDLTSNKILSIDCFFNTVMFELESCVLFCPLEFDYDTNHITSLYDDCTIINNINQTDLRFEKTWVNTKTKSVVVLNTSLSGTKFVPNLFNLDLTNNSFTKIFPLRTEDLNNIHVGLSGIDILRLDRAAMHYNSLQQTYLITYKGLDLSSKMFVIDFEVEQQEDLILKKVNRYLDSSFISLIIDPPEVTNSSYFTTYNVVSATPFSIVLSAENLPTSWNIVSTHPFTISVDNFGHFTGMIPTPGMYYINYEVTNSGGSIMYPLTIKVS